jgi:hypothetical protein
VLSAERTVQPGHYLETELETRSTAPLHMEEEFLDALAGFLMSRYEGSPISQPMVLRTVRFSSPSRTKHFYRRLFDNLGNPTQAFLTWASETLALWIESALDESLYAEAGVPHASDPAFDVLSIIQDGSMPRLRITQVKATETNLQANCSGAIGVTPVWWTVGR